eukprot:283310-Chlamydomonas_euryale.AAC.11
MREGEQRLRLADQREVFPPHVAVARQVDWLTCMLVVGMHTAASLCRRNKPCCPSLTGPQQLVRFAWQDSLYMAGNCMAGIPCMAGQPMHGRTLHDRIPHAGQDTPCRAGPFTHSHRTSCAQVRLPKHEFAPSRSRGRPGAAQTRLLRLRRPLCHRGRCHAHTAGWRFSARILCACGRRWALGHAWRLACVRRHPCMPSRRQCSSGGVGATSLGGHGRSATNGVRRMTLGALAKVPGAWQRRRGLGLGRTPLAAA